jgi:hypothetical protein
VWVVGKPFTSEEMKKDSAKKLLKGLAKNLSLYLLTYYLR